jgi:hypothetical protein
MMKKFLYIPVFMIVVLAVYSCSGDQEQEIPKGDIIGFVKIFDQYANPYSDNSGITIRLYRSAIQHTGAFGN